MNAQQRFAFGPELIVDLFAGGGGASLGIEQAFGRSPDVAVNHDPDAVALHAANHPATQHYRRDVFEVNPLEATGGKPVGLLWASPDCKHFSKAKGGKPVSKKIRGLAWVVVKWATLVRPRVIILENVEEFVTWGPVLATGKPCPRRRGTTFARWKRQLERLGYVVDHRELRACDYGAPTSRKRFFLIARCDGLPIVWPKPTHGKGLQPYRTAADCIDFSLLCPSIFLTREQARAIGVKRPLAEATMRRIWKGLDRFVINAAKPFIVPIQNYGWGDRCTSIDDPLRTITAHPKGGAFALAQPFVVPLTHHGDRRSHPVNEPLPTVTGAHRGELALTAPYLVPRYGERPTQEPRALPVDAPMPTIVPTANGGALVAAFMAQQNGGVVGHQTYGHDMRKPVSTISGKGAQQQLVVSHLSKLYGTSTGADPREPAPTVTASGNHLAEVRAFLIAYYGNEKDGRALTDPMGTVVSRERFGLVTVDGTDYEIADIGLRMLTPRELFRAQGFDESYVIDRGADGKRLTKEAQVRLCGNSVCPPIAKALVAANCGASISLEREAIAA